MTAYRLTAKARADLRTIWSFIARDNKAAAFRVTEAVYDACALLSVSPLHGHKREDLIDLDVRFWPVARFPKYVIVYDPAAVPLSILRVLHGARNFSRELRNR